MIISGQPTLVEHVLGEARKDNIWTLLCKLDYSEQNIINCLVFKISSLVTYIYTQIWEAKNRRDWIINLIGDMNLNILNMSCHVSSSSLSCLIGHDKSLFIHESFVPFLICALSLCLSYSIYPPSLQYLSSPLR